MGSPNLLTGAPSFVTSRCRSNAERSSAFLGRTARARPRQFVCCGLLTPDQGNGTCLGYDIRTETLKIKVNVGYMTQRFSLYEDLSVRENLEFIARIYGLPRTANAAAEMIARLGLRGREEQVAGKLS